MAYDYGEANGPHTWALKFPNAGGCKQSPININTSSMDIDESLQPLVVDFSSITSQDLTVKDHNFSVSVHGDGTLSGGPLKSKYTLVQFHFHWGSGNNWGSEHMINGVSCPAELHCVFMNKKYDTFESAITYTDGLAVLGVFLQLSRTPNPTLGLLCQTLHQTKKHETVGMESLIDLRKLMPKNLARYYTYPGSLTTPPCNECVTWLVLDEPISISEDELEIMRNMHLNCATCGATDNFRPICPVGRRLVKSSFTP